MSSEEKNDPSSSHNWRTPKSLTFIIEYRFQTADTRLFF